MSDDYYLPPETAHLLTPIRLQQCKNLGLLLDKYAPQTAVDKSEGKGAWFKELVSNSHIDIRLAEEVFRRWRNTIKEMQARYFTATTQGRMVVGLGGGTVLETDLTLHYLYGMPLIPGSALKGLTRAYVTGEVAEHKSEEMENDDPLVQRIFGTQKDAGSVIFFDAMPVDGKVEIELDIMNAHYPKYYAENELPTNSQKLNLVTFLTVTRTTFLFALAPRRPESADDVEQAMEWLQSALQEYGVGGKTSAGYGYFTNVQQPDVTTAPAVQTQAEKDLPASVQYIRPNMRKFAAGEGIVGTVLAPTEELRQMAPEAVAFLRYLEFPVNDVLIIVTAEEGANWIPKNTENCLFVSEEERDGCTVLICQPGGKKKKKKSR